ncbi:hypothetical protein [Thiohalocapsa sp. ML1]|jgi:hypothetical protein|uniref:hypothetical protein n=1 Tax=Thiohalocapsa sp. ML1 TaxID=1431688 RepID=UPI000731F62F|nr:hypothetical protein [Thiohalocapsa sp. ML1]
MSRGIQLKQLTETDLGHLGLAPDTLQGGLDLATDGDWLDTDALAIAREVRRTLEAVFDILTEALPGERA